jgi:4-amino-4-deoxy-L-arabinose transferase-like glycosyltransferase
MTDSPSPAPAGPGYLHSTRFQAIVLTALVLFLFWWRLGSLGLIDPDEPFYALTSREMVQSGDWITPRVFGEPQFEKPILFYWETCLAQMAFGDNEFAARVPGALAASLVVFLTWGIGRKLFSPLAGFLGAIVVGTGGLFVIMSRLMLTDLSHTLFISASMYCLWRAFHDEPKRLRWLIALTVCSALSMLTKGPQGLLFVAMAGLAYGWLSGLKSPWSWRNLAICVPLWLLIAAPWYLAMFILHKSGPTSPATGWGYYWDSFFVHENWDRFFHAEHNGNDHWYYYLEMLIGGSIPWIPLIVASLWETAANFRRRFRTQPGLAMVICWLIPSYLFMTVAASKLPSYIFFLTVPVGLLAGVTLERWITQGFGPLERWAVGLFTLLQGVALIWYMPTFHPNSLPFLPQLIALGIPLTVAGIFALSRKAFLWAGVSVSFNIVLVFTAFFWIEARLEGTVGSREICKVAAAVRKPGEKLVTCSFLGRAAKFYLGEQPSAIFVPDPKLRADYGKGNFRPYYPFYSYHPLPQLTIEKQLGAFADSNGSVLCIGEKRDFSQLNTAESSSVKGRCELLGETGDTPGRAVFRINQDKAHGPQSKPKQ